jgi:hypothetical protein
MTEKPEMYFVFVQKRVGYLDILRWGLHDVAALEHLIDGIESHTHPEYTKVVTIIRGTELSFIRQTSVSLVE